MKRRISVLLAAVSMLGMLQLASPTPASACADPHCPWSPVTGLVRDTLWWVDRNCEWILGPVVDPNPCVL